MKDKCFQGTAPLSSLFKNISHWFHQTLGKINWYHSLRYLFLVLYSTGNSAQCYVAAWMGGEFGGEWSEVKVARSCLSFCDPISCTVHGIAQARMPGRVAVPFSGGSSQPRSPALRADSFPAEPWGKPTQGKRYTCVCRSESLCCSPENYHNVANQLYLNMKYNIKKEDIFL